MFNAYLITFYMPRFNPHPSTLARLRAVISEFQGYPCTQKDLARLVAPCAAITIQSIERGKLNLSPKLARRIAEATGVSMEWLINGKPSSGPLDAHGRKLSREVWLAHQADKKTGKHARSRLAVNLHAFIPPLAGVAVAAAKSGQLPLFLEDLKNALTGLVKRYGKDEEGRASAVDSICKGKGVQVIEPGFYAVPDAERVWKFDARAFSEEGDVLCELGASIDLQAVLSDPRVYAVTAEVLPAAERAEIQKLHPASRPGAKIEVQETEVRTDKGVTRIKELVPAKKSPRKPQKPQK